MARATGSAMLIFVPIPNSAPFKKIGLVKAALIGGKEAKEAKESTRAGHDGRRLFKFCLKNIPRQIDVIAAHGAFNRLSRPVTVLRIWCRITHCIKTIIGEKFGGPRIARLGGKALNIGGKHFGRTNTHAVKFLAFGGVTGIQLAASEIERGSTRNGPGQPGSRGIVRIR